MSDENYVEQKNCVPQSYPSFLNSLPSSLKHNTQLSWNFGVSLFNVKAWRAKQMTQRYENMLRLNYRHRVFPETSLAFGLGVPYLAFAGEVACLEDLDFHVLDGLVSSFLTGDLIAARLMNSFYTARRGLLAGHCSRRNQ
jgi:hypothetical protein